MTERFLFVHNLEQLVTYTFSVRAQTIDYGPRELKKGKFNFKKTQRKFYPYRRISNEHLRFPFCAVQIASNNLGDNVFCGVLRTPQNALSFIFKKPFWKQCASPLSMFFFFIICQENPTEFFVLTNISQQIQYIFVAKAILLQQYIASFLNSVWVGTKNTVNILIASCQHPHPQQHPFLKSAII